MVNQPKAAVIYVLIDPISHEIRYVGWTTQPKQRLKTHICAKKKCYCATWIRSLKRSGDLPVMRTLQMVNSDFGPSAEKYWISYFLDIGCRLTNLTEGGEGTAGYHHTQESRRRMSAARGNRNFRTGIKHTPETREKLSEATRHQFSNPEARAAVSKVHKGKIISPEHRAVIGAASKRRWEEWRAKGLTMSQEVRAKLRAARLGKPLTEECKAKLSATTRGVPKSPESKAKKRATLEAKRNQLQSA